MWKNWSLTKPFFEFILFKFNFFIFCTKMDLFTLMYKVTKMEHTLATWFINGSMYFRRPPTYMNLSFYDFELDIGKFVYQIQVKKQIQKVFDQKLLLFQPITGQLFEFEFLIWIFIHNYSYLSSYYRNSFRGYLWIFNVKQSCLTYFLSNWLLCNGKINAEIIDFHSLFFALLIWWLVGSAGLLVGHPFDTLKVRLTLTIPNKGSGQNNYQWYVHSRNLWGSFWTPL